MKKINFAIISLLIFVFAGILFLQFEKNKKTFFSNTEIEKTISVSEQKTNFSFPEIENSKSVSNSVAILKKPVLQKNKFVKNQKEEFENGEADEMPLAQKIEEAFELEKMRTKNPFTGEVPSDGAFKALQNAQSQQIEFAKNQNFFRGVVGNAKWQERGPSNVGGRTRAILVDANDATHKTIFAGGSTGGIFKNTNITDPNSKWIRINDWMSNLSISSLAQDPNNPKILYAGSGDCDGRDAQGAGIFKSLDGGNTWAQLPSTNNAFFQTNPSIVVLPGSGEVLAGTFKGLYKSKDGGASFNKVLGSGIDFGSALNDIYRIVLASDGTLYACTDNEVFKSKGNGDQGTWVNIATANGFPRTFARTEIAVAPTNPNVVYAVGNIKNAGSVVYTTLDGGNSWTAGTQPVFIDGCNGAGSQVDFTRGQAWYDLTLAVSPLDEKIVFLGGVDEYKSVDGGKTFKQISFWANCRNATKPYDHADHHAAVFESNTSDILYTGSDGGVFRYENASQNNFTILERTNNYSTAQFYGGAINPTSGASQFLAGAQDNGTNSVVNGGIGVATQVIGGDGFLTFIDQQNANYQIGSLYYGNWFLSKDGGKSFTTNGKSNGGFLCPADFDSKTKILYAQTKDADLWLWDVSQKVPKATTIDVPNFTANTSSNLISFIKVDPYTNNRIYVGFNNGNLYRIDNANDAATVSSANIGLISGNTSSIDIDRNNTQHLLLTVSSYGVPHVFESKNGGTKWTNITSNLPDLPVRDVLFSPNGDNKALIATDLGVWSTKNLDSTKTVWSPPVPGRGTPLVRTSALKLRESDKVVLAATYGRGLFTSTVFTNPSAVAEFFPISYLNTPIQFFGGSSGNANTYLWNFGDNTTDTLETSTHSFSQIGTYNVSLNVNGDPKLVSSKKIKILPKLTTPYALNTPNYSGDFETTDAPFGAYSPTGSQFERAKSTVIGKEGTHSGNYAYVLGAKEQNYQANTEAFLYLPLFDMAKSGIYTFSFWALYDIQKGYDGFRVQYSLDKGATWLTLGTKADTWYDYTNAGVQGAFANGDSYFSGTLDTWTKFKIDVSFMANNPDVAFRFQFLSSDFSPLTGVAIDDVQLSIYEGKNKTAFASQSGNFTSSQTSIDFNFATLPEYYVNTYDVEVSTNGKAFEKKVTKIKPLSGVSGELQSYKARWDGSPLDIYYARIVANCVDTRTNYLDTVYSPVFVVKRGANATASARTIYPNPFGNTLSVTFDEVVTTPVNFQIFNAIGQLMFEKTEVPNSVFYDLTTSNLANGTYLLSIKIGEGNRQTFKVICSN